jgi:hypothetical protein
MGRGRDAGGRHHGQWGALDVSKCSQRSKETVQGILRLDESRRHYNTIIQALEQSV